MSVEISRKGFLAGMSAAAWSMLYGSPADAGEKRLRLGVMSDVHIFRPGDWAEKRFKLALDWCRSSDVDGVLIAGDLTEEGYEEQLAEQKAALEEHEAEEARILEEQTLLKARLHAYRQMDGSIGEEGDFTDRQRFEELEKEYEALGALLKGQWKKTKKKIRARVLWNKTEDGKDGEDS